MKRSSSMLLPALLSAASLSVASLAAAQEPAPQSNLEAGGLRPPEAVDGSGGSAAPPPDPEQARPEEELQRADEEDAGRGLEWVWLNAEIGAQHLGLATFNDDQLVDPSVVETTQTGLAFGGGVGVRLLVFTLGARFRFASFSDFQLWTLGAEGGLHIPLGRLEPYFTVGAGYAALGSFSDSSPASSEAEVKGFNARLGFGIDYYLSNTFSVGANLTGDVLFLSRPALAGSVTSGGSESEARVYSADGSSIGAGGTLTAVAGLHF